MNQNIKAFDQAFKDKLAAHAVSPPAGMLADIQAGMVKKNNNRKAF